MGPPDAAIAGDPEVRAATAGVVRVIGTACGLGVSGSGWVAAPGLVVTNAHVVAGSDDTAVSLEDDDTRRDAVAVHYDPSNDLALLAVDGLEAAPLPIAQVAASGTEGAIVGFPENGPLSIVPARLGTTETTTTEDSYGNGPAHALAHGLPRRGALGQLRRARDRRPGAGADDGLRLDRLQAAGRLRHPEPGRAGRPRGLDGRGRHRSLHALSAAQVPSPPAAITIGKVESR